MFCDVFIALFVTEVKVKDVFKNGVLEVTKFDGSHSVDAIDGTF